MSAKTRYLKLMDRPRKGWKLADRAVFLRRFVEEATALIEEGLARDGVVKIHEFGTFQLKWLEERQGRNPRTGEPILIPGQYRVSFRPVAKLESRVNWPYAHLKAELIEPPIERRPKVESIPEAEPAPAPAAISLFEIEDAFNEPARPQGPGEAVVYEPVQPTYLRPPISWSPASPPPSRMRFDLLEEEEEPAPANAYAFNPKETFGKNDGSSKKETYVGEIRTRPNGIVPAPVSSQRVEPHVRRPSFMQERERRPGRIKWFASFAAVLLLLLLFLAKPVREQWHLVTEAWKTAMSKTIQTSQPQVSQNTNSAQPSPASPAATAPTRTFGFAGGTHQVIRGDNLWGISGHYYVDPYLWPNIYRVNTDKIGDPDVLETAQILSLPILYGTFDKLSPQDRRNLAEGYFLVFTHYKQTQKHLAPFALWAAVRFDRTILDAHKEMIGQDELAFLEAHNVGDIASR
ncbi:MAG: HU family DNA-binding protein [bacterium]